MEFNSQICTTREQSERLLALGIKKETADCVIYYSSVRECDRYVNKMSELESDEFPAWSLARLIEMMPKCVPSSIAGIDAQFSVTHRYDGSYTAGYAMATEAEGNVYDAIIRIIQWAMEEGYWGDNHEA